MPNVPKPVVSFVATIADGQELPVSWVADRHYYVQTATAVKLGGTGGAGDTADVYIADTLAVANNMNATTAGTIDTAQSTGVLEVNPGEVVEVRPTVGAGNNAVRMFVVLVPVE